jgi:hypothetical protein
MGHLSICIWCQNFSRFSVSLNLTKMQTYVSIGELLYAHYILVQIVMLMLFFLSFLFGGIEV